MKGEEGGPSAYQRQALHSVSGKYNLFMILDTKPLLKKNSNPVFYEHDIDKSEGALFSDLMVKNCSDTENNYGGLQYFQRRLFKRQGSFQKRVSTFVSSQCKCDRHAENRPTKHEVKAEIGEIYFSSK